jgi:hypothetical protein
MNEHGTYSFVILINLQQPEPTLAATLGGHMPDIVMHLNMDSHQPEAAALFAALTYTQQLLTMYPCPPTVTPAAYI